VICLGLYASFAINFPAEKEEEEEKKGEEEEKEGRGHRNRNRTLPRKAFDN